MFKEVYGHPYLHMKTLRSVIIKNKPHVYKNKRLTKTDKIRSFLRENDVEAVKTIINSVKNM